MAIKLTPLKDVPETIKKPPKVSIPERIGQATGFTPQQITKDIPEIISLGAGGFAGTEPGRKIGLEAFERGFGIRPLANVVTKFQETSLREKRLPTATELIESGTAPLRKLNLPPEEKKSLIDIFRNYQVGLNGLFGLPLDAKFPGDEASAIAGGIGLRFAFPDLAFALGRASRAGVKTIANASKATAQQVAKLPVKAQQDLTNAALKLQEGRDITAEIADFARVHGKANAKIAAQALKETATTAIKPEFGLQQILPGVQRPGILQQAPVQPSVLTGTPQAIPTPAIPSQIPVPSVPTPAATILPELLTRIPIGEIESTIPTTDTEVGRPDIVQQDPLIAEAKKYKTAEEFVKDLDKKYVFHATIKGDVTELQQGTFFGNLDEAMDFLKNAERKEGKKGTIYAVPKAEIKPIEAEADDIFGQEWIKAGLAQRSGKAHTPTFKITDKAQLTEIWNKAQGDLLREDPIRPIPEDIHKELPREPDDDIEAATSSDEAGFIRFPGIEDIGLAKDRLLSLIDVEAPFKAIDAPQTGINVKNFFSIRTLEEDKALEGINQMNKLSRLTPEDGTNLALMVEQPALFEALPADEQARLKPAFDIANNLTKRAFESLKELGALSVPFPQSLANRLQDRNLHLKELIRKKPAKSDKWQEELKENQAIVTAINEGKIRFVSIPTRLWFDNLTKNDPVRAKKILKTLSTRTRTTPTIQSLINEGLIAREEIDIRDSIGNMGYNLGKDRGLLNILNAAKKEGLLKSDEEAPEDFVSLPAWKFPLLKGFRAHPFFADYIVTFLEGSSGAGKISKILGLSKMAQFYNPLFLPMYDVVQAGMLGAVNVKSPFNLFKAVEASVKKNDLYWEAFENGLFSQPYSNPFDKFQEKLENLKQANTSAGSMTRLLKTLEHLLPQNAIKLLYNLSWNTAWSLDKVIRLMSYSHLINSGIDPLEAGQIAAKFHGDYASVPPKTRALLNKILFTPTFQIAMGKLYGEMIGSITKSLGPNPRPRIMARGLLMTLGIILGKHLWMTKGMRFSTDQFSRRYFRNAVTDEGAKELVMTFSNPANLPLRYAYQIAGAFEPSTTNTAKKLFRTFRFQLHPVYRTALDIANNQKPNFDYVYNPFDRKDKQIISILRYATGEIVRISAGLIQEAPDERGIKAFRQLQKEVGKLAAVAVKPFTFVYLREPEDVRTARKVRRLKSEIKRFTRERADRPEQVNVAIENFIKRTNKILGEEPKKKPKLKLTPLASVPQ